MCVTRLLDPLAVAPPQRDRDRRARALGDVDEVDAAGVALAVPLARFVLDEAGYALPSVGQKRLAADRRVQRSRQSLCKCVRERVTCRVGGVHVEID